MNITRESFSVDVANVGLALFVVANILCVALFPFLYYLSGDFSPWLGGVLYPVWTFMLINGMKKAWKKIK